MSETPARIREERLVPPSARGVEEPLELKRRVQSAARRREEKLAAGRELADDLATEFGEVTDEEREALRAQWPLD